MCILFFVQARTVMIPTFWVLHSMMCNVTLHTDEPETGAINYTYVCQYFILPACSPGCNRKGRAVSMKRRVLFLCTGNACRSQIAEAIVNARLGGTCEAVSAGTRPDVSANPNTRRVLREIGITHRGRPKSVDKFRGQHFDLVVTVCSAASEECPVWLGTGQRIHVGFPDPAHVSGDEETVLAAFRSVRDDMLARILGLLESWGDGNPNPS
jgi:arsenate reductase (thioredoxin)